MNDNTNPNQASIEQIIALLPQKPGVYIMKNTENAIIYVGKSRALKKRVASYFNRLHDNLKTRALVAAVTDIEYIITNTEVEALILENNLIKKHKPRYNILLKDSKTHPYIRLTTADLYPKLEKVRKVSYKDKNQYFGPFPSGSDLNHIVELLSKSYRLCTSKKTVKLLAPTKGKNVKPCLRYHLELCQGACMGVVSPAEYAVSVKKVQDILSGREPMDFARLEKQLKDLTKAFRYEEAADLRDTIVALKRFFDTQRVEFLTPVDIDFWGMSILVDKIIYSVFIIRGGKLLGNRILEVEREPEKTDEEVFEAVLSRHYDSNLIPSSIYAAMEPDGLKSLLEVLRERAGFRVSFHVPQKGQYYKLLEMATSNANEVLKSAAGSLNERISDAVLDLQKRLGLANPPIHIECIDISHIQGTDPVASVVVSKNNLLKKSEYRLFHIKTAHGGDDPASIAEVTRRRFIRIIEEGSAMPDLFVVDGGITQVNAAKAVLEELGVDTPLFGLAEREETLVSEQGFELQLPFSSLGMRLLIGLRNEAHRFCNSFQQKTRSKRVFRSSLLSLPGVGPVTIKKLVLEFGSTAKAAEFGPEEVARRCSLPLKTAELIVEALKSEQK
jgi:excinuclease ABC subunit C